MKKAIILDPAHGKNTKGKRSPDERHFEWEWSRARIEGISNYLITRPTKFELYSPFLTAENEPGLTNRVVRYNKIAKEYDHTLVLSLHNDAYGNDWSKPHGVSVWTSKGQTSSDKYATNLFNFIHRKYPNEKMRAARWEDNDPDWEADFTILNGNSKVKPLYDAVLLEWLFQTNKEDVEKLLNPIHNEYFEDMISEWLISI